MGNKGIYVCCFVIEDHYRCTDQQYQKQKLCFSLNSKLHNTKRNTLNHQIVLTPTKPVSITWSERVASSNDGGTIVIETHLKIHYLKRKYKNRLLKIVIFTKINASLKFFL